MSSSSFSSFRMFEGGRIPGSIVIYNECTGVAPRIHNKKKEVIIVNC